MMKRIRPSRKARAPIPAPQRHRDRKNDYRRVEKHRASSIATPTKE